MQQFYLSGKDTTPWKPNVHVSNRVIHQVPFKGFHLKRMFADYENPTKRD
jgi:hypothetical protein